MNTKVTVGRLVAQSLLLASSLVVAAVILFGTVIQAWAIDALTPITRASINSDGVEGNDDSEHPAISADGRYVAFYSDSDNLVLGDTNGVDDIFRKDMLTGEVVRVSTDSDGNQSNEVSFEPSISADGRYVAFVSYASNLVANDTNAQFDIFVKDVQTGETVRASTSSAGVESNSGNNGASISPDGRYVAFASSASNLIANDTNAQRDIFLKDLSTEELVRVSVDQAGVEANNHSRIGDYYSGGKVVSANGRYVAFQSNATNLVPGGGYSGIVVKDLQTGEVTRVTEDDGGYGGGSITPDGRFAAFAAWDVSDIVILVTDLQTQVTERIDTDADGVPANFSSEYDPSISADGRYVVFNSNATNLVPGDTNSGSDIFVKDRANGDIARVSISALGAEADDYNYEHSISADGRYIVFSSYATNIVTGDANASGDIFYRANPLALFLEDEDFSSSKIAAGSASGSVLGSATKNGQTIDPTDYILSIVDNGGLTGVIINADGTLTIPQDAAGGNYTVTYQVCESAAPTYCSTATAVLGVSATASELAETGARATAAVSVLAVATSVLALRTMLARRRYVYGRRYL